MIGKYKISLFLGLFWSLLLITGCSNSNEDNIIGIWEMDQLIWTGTDSLMQQQIAAANLTMQGNEREMMYFEKDKYGSMMPDGEKIDEKEYQLFDDHILVNGLRVDYKLTDDNTLQISDAGEGLVIQLKRKK